VCGGFFAERDLQRVALLLKETCNVYIVYSECAGYLRVYSVCRVMCCCGGQGVAVCCSVLQYVVMC